MAGGEAAKRSGDFGEKIVKNLIELMGWKNNISNIGVTCVHEDKHKIANAEKRVKHGIDFLFQYRCPLKDGIQQNVIISSKHRDGYPETARGKKTKFKEFLYDIAYASECFPTNEHYRTKTSGTTKKELTGVIFWIDSSEEQRGNGVTQDISDFRLSEELEYKTVLLVDNPRADFIYDSIKFAHNEYGDEKVEFFYIDTGYNNCGLERSYSGKILPVEYLNADVLPFKIKDKDNGDVLLLTVNDIFNEDYLKRLIGLSQDLTKNWSPKIVIAFPDFSLYHHEGNVITAKQQFNDIEFISKIEIKCFKPNFRSMQEE
jgi:hypothetical protein